MSVLQRVVRHIAARLAALAGDAGGLPLNLVAPAQIESLGRLRLTPDVHILEAEAHTSARLETHFTARLSLPPAQLAAFLAGTLVRGPLTADASALPREIMLQARGKRSLLAGQAVQGQTRQYILVDTSDPARFIVHIATHSR